GPDGDVVPVTDRGEVPAGRGRVDRVAEVDHAVAADAVGVDERVLAVGEPDQVADVLDYAEGVDALPPEVTRVEVHAQVRAGVLGQAPVGARRVGRRPGVQLEADRDSWRGAGRPARELAPERAQAVLE